MPEWIQLVISVGGLVFLAGGGWRLLQQLRRDVNGIGAKANEEKKAADKRRYNLTIALMVVIEEQTDREKLAKLLRED